jgi:mRNA interferase RelE/StbE
MTYTIFLRQRARKAYLALDRPVRKRIDEAIDKLAADPRPPGTKPLTGEPGVFRIRIGDYRVLYEIHEERLIVEVIDVGHRREIYRSVTQPSPRLFRAMQQGLLDVPRLRSVRARPWPDGPPYPGPHPGRRFGGQPLWAGPGMKEPAVWVTRESYWVLVTAG